MPVFEPTFKWDSGTGAVVVEDESILSLYACLKDAMGPAVTMDSGRQTKTQRQPKKSDVEDNVNTNINHRAAKVTKCIVNYMASGADKTVFEQENLLATSTSDEQYSPYDPVTGESGETTAYEEITATQHRGTGVLLFAAEDDNLVDLYWEINYMKAPVDEIKFDPPDD